MRLWGMEKAAIEADPTGLPERASIFETRYDRQFDRALATIERRRNLKSRVEPTSHSKQTQLPAPSTHQSPEIPGDAGGFPAQEPQTQEDAESQPEPELY
jgi:hypothetical protein